MYLLARITLGLLTLNGLATSMPHVERDDSCKATVMDDIPEDNTKRYIHANCDAAQIMFERVAWAEAGILAHSFNQWVPGGNFQNAMDLYMGPDTANGKKGQNGIVYKDAIVDIQNKEYRAHTSHFPPGNDIYVFCDETPFDKSFFEKMKCDVDKKTCCDNRTNAYTWNVDGWSGTRHNTVFCPKFWTLQTLSEQLRYLENSDNFTEKMVVNKLWSNIGGSYFHESIHWAPSISQVNHRPGDHRYTPWGVLDLAKDRGTRWAWQNAESYLIAAIAIFQQQTFCLAYPPEPDYNDKPSENPNLDISDDDPSAVLDFPHTKFLNGTLDSGDITWPDGNDTKTWTPSKPYPLDKNSYVNRASHQYPPAPACVGTPDGDILPYVQRDYAMDTINNKFCPYMTTGNKAVGKDVSAPMFLLPESPYAAVGYPTSDQKPGDPQQALWLSVSLLQNKECATGFEVDGATCNLMFHTILDNCNTDTTTNKYGGSIVYGCQIYEMRTSRGGGDEPPEGLIAEGAAGWNGF